MEIYEGHINLYKERRYPIKLEVDCESVIEYAYKCMLSCRRQGEGAHFVDEELCIVSYDEDYFVVGKNRKRVEGIYEEEMRFQRELHLSQLKRLERMAKLQGASLKGK